MAPSNGCTMDCSGDPGTYCDRGTRKCEDCIDICHPSRGTESNCLEQITCKEFWSMSSSTVPTVSPESTGGSSQWLTPVAIMALIIGFILVIVVLIIILRKRGYLKLKCLDRACKSPIQESARTQQEMEEMAKLNSTPVNPLDYACAEQTPEVNDFTPTSNIT